MTMSVVDRFEAIEIDQQQGVIESAAPAIREGRLEVFVKPTPVGQACEQVGAGYDRSVRQGSAQPQVTSQSEPSGDEQSGQKRESARLTPGSGVELGRTALGERS